MFADDAILDGPSAEGFYFCGAVLTRVDQELQTSSGLSEGPLNHNACTARLCITRRQSVALRYQRGYAKNRDSRRNYAVNNESLKEY
jgi:hypothetical protein